MTNDEDKGVIGTAGLLRRLLDGYFRLMSQDGDEIFFQRYDLRRGYTITRDNFTQAYLVFDLKGTRMPSMDLTTGEQGMKCGIQYFALFAHENKESVTQLLDAVVKGVLGQSK